MTAHHWTEAEKDLLRQKYDGTNANAIAAELGLTRQQVRGQIQGLKLSKKEHRDWTEEELEYLGDAWGVRSDEEICKHLNRSLPGVILAVKRHLKINRKMNMLTASELARVFGVDSKTITGTWMRKGFLQGRKAYARCGNNRMWFFTDENVEACLRQRPWLADLARIEDRNQFRQIVEGEWSRDPWYQPKQVAKMTRLPLSNIMKQLLRGHIKADKKPGAPWSGMWIIRRSAIEAFLSRRVRGMSTCKCGHTHATHRAGGRCTHSKFRGKGVRPLRCRCRKYKPTHLFSLQAEVTAIEWAGDNDKEICGLLPIGSITAIQEIEGCRHLGVDVFEGDSFDLVPGDWVVMTPGRRVFTMPPSLFLELFYAKGERVPLLRRRNYRATQNEGGA